MKIYKTLVFLTNVMECLCNLHIIPKQVYNNINKFNCMLCNKYYNFMFRLKCKLHKNKLVIYYDIEMK